MINEKQRINAVTSYFFMAIFFIIPSKNKDVRNKFVLSHAKNALFLQLLLIISYIIFIHFGYFNDFFILKQSLNHILMITCSIIILALMAIGIFKANTGEGYSIFNARFKSITSFLRTKEESYGEKQKLITILSYIPFVGIFINKNNKEEPILSISKFSSLIGIFFAFLYMWKANNAISLSILFYLIFIIFIGLVLFVKNELLFFSINLPTFYDIYINFRTIICYVSNLILGREFIEYKKLKEKIIERLKNISIADKEKLELKNKCEINNKVFYIPVFNIIGLVFLRTKAKNHIISGFILTFLFVLLYIFNLTNYSLFLLFFMVYGITNSDNVGYRLPFVFDIYAFIIFLIGSIKSLKNKAKQKSQTKEVSMKVGEK